MSGTVNYPKVIDQLTDVIKELNVGFAPCGEAAPAAPSAETRRADAVGLLKALLSTLEQGPATAAGAAAAEHDASADRNSDVSRYYYDTVEKRFKLLPMYHQDMIRTDAAFRNNWLVTSNAEQTAIVRKYLGSGVFRHRAEFVSNGA